MGGGSTAKTPTQVAYLPSVANCLTARMFKGFNSTLSDGQTPIVTTGGVFVDAISFHNRQDPDVSGDVTHPIGAKDNGMGIGLPIPIDTMNHLGRKDNHSLGDFEPGAPSYTLTKGHSHAVAQPIAFAENFNAIKAVEIAPAMTTGGYNTGQNAGGLGLIMPMQVRRLTPRECERLQGFPDDYTLIPWRGKEAPDGPRYKALGNSMAVPVMRWIGNRLNKVVDIALKQS